MACKIKFYIGNQKIELQTNNTEDEFNQYGLDLVVENIKNNHNLAFKESLLSKIEDVISEDIAIKDYSEGDLIPNFTGQQLIQMFPDEKWGTSVPNVLLVQDNDRRLGGNFLYAKRVFQNSKEIYIVPISNIKGFALTTRALDIIEQIRTGKIDLKDSGLENIHQIIYSRDFSNEEKTVNSDIEKHKKALIKEAQQNLDKINKKSEIARIKKKIETAKKNLEAHPQSKVFQQKIQEYEKDLERAEQIYIQEKENAERRLEEVKEKDVDGFAYSLQRILKDKKESSIELNFDTEAKFLEHFIKNISYWSKTLPTDLYYNIYRNFSQLLGWNFNNATQDQLVLTIEGLMTYDRVQKQSYIKIVDLYNYFLEKGIIKNGLKLSDFKVNLKQLLDLYYNNKGNNYQLKHIGDSEIFFKRKFETLAEQLKIGIDTTNSIKFQEEYRGFFIFKVENEFNEERFFFTKKWLNKQTLSSTIQTFSDIDGLKEKINSIVDENFSIYYNSHVFLSNSEDLESIKVRSNDYRNGDIIGVIDYKSGPNKIPYRYTKDLFYSFIDSTFTETHANEIKKRIDSADKMELFYSYFGRMPSYEYNKASYDEYMKKVFDFLSDMDNVKYKYYFVNYTFSTKSNDTYVRLTDVTDYDKKQDGNLQINRPVRQSSTIGLEVIRQMFGKYGINVQIVNNDEMKKITGLDENTSGFHSGGIIYLNRDSASIGTALHEYTHLLLGLLKISSFEKYNTLLSNFYELVKSSQAFAKIIQDYKDLKEVQNLNEHEKNIYYTEELFAKMYSLFLQQQFDYGTPLSAIFSEASQSIASSAMFENLKISDLFENAKKPLDVLLNFSKQMKDMRKNIGFGLIDPNVQSNIVVKEFIEQNSVEQNGKDDVDGKIIKECID